MSTELAKNARLLARNLQRGLGSSQTAPCGTVVPARLPTRAYNVTLALWLS